jgi:hypothetical protein
MNQEHVHIRRHKLSAPFIAAYIVTVYVSCHVIIYGGQLTRWYKMSIVLYAAFKKYTRLINRCRMTQKPF